MGEFKKIGSLLFGLRLLVFTQATLSLTGILFIYFNPYVSFDSFWARSFVLVLILACMATFWILRNAFLRLRETDEDWVQKRRLEFISNVSHELRTPLTSIQGYAELIEEDLEKDQKDICKESLQAVKRNTQRLLELSSDLLVLSKLEESANSLQREWVKTKDITEEALEGLRQKGRNFDQLLELSLNSLDRVYCDKDRAIQVLVNLLDNAYRYAGPNSKIILGWKLKDNSTWLEIADNGPGISEEHQRRIFERFFRVDEGRSRDKGGTGLGLSIVKSILTAHGGSVFLESTKGQGSKFTCKFPGPT